MAQITKQFTFISGTKADPVQVNADLDALYTQVNAQDTSIGTINSQLAGAEVNPKASTYGAKGDGAADDTIALQNAFNAATNGTIFIPSGTYKTTGTINIVGPMNIIFASTKSIIKFTGSGDALKIANQKNINITSGTIDISTATTNPTALHIAGLWFSQINNLTVIQGVAGSNGIFIETSAVGGNNFGAYMIQIFNYQMVSGIGYAAIQTKVTAGDTGQAVTHLQIFGGWVQGPGYGAYISDVLGGSLDGLTCEGGTNDGIYIKNTADFKLSPGELIGYTGWGINFGTGNSNIYYFMPNTSNTGGTAGFINTATYAPFMLTGSTLQLFASRTDQTYTAMLVSQLNYNEALILYGRGGGGSLRKVLTWAEGTGLHLMSSPFGAIEVNGVPNYTWGTGATTVGAAGGAAALPATPVGYLNIQLNGTAYKMPYYNV